MENYDLLNDVNQRTGGDIYLGVVGPVRTGKSTFIKRFMETLVLPNISDPYDRERALDELPQSGAGRTVMTGEPKFVPAEAVEITVADGIDMRVRLVDCVGYLVEGALGFEDENGPRMVDTPWFEDPVSFAEAAEVGTRKVITDHSTIGLVVLTDGSFGDIPRENFMEAEQRVIGELKELHKPFVILLNSARPSSEATQVLAEQLSATHDVSVIPINATALSYNDLLSVLSAALYEFPVTEVNISLPNWIEELDENHWLRQSLEEGVAAAVSGLTRVRDLSSTIEALNMEGLTDGVTLEQLELGSGNASINIDTAPGLFHQVLEEYAGEPIEGDHTVLKLMKRFSNSHRQWNKFEEAMEEVYNNGYGVVTPRIDEMYLEEPELIKQGGRFGVKLKASAPSYHVIRCNIATEITPLIGSEKQCEELMRYMLDEFEDDPQKIWNTNIFGKSLHELVSEGISSKVCSMPENAQEKLQETVQRIVNDSGGGLICIII